MKVLLAQLTSLDLDNFAQSPSTAVTAAADLTTQLNFGIRTISRFIKQFDPSVVLTLSTNTLKYDLRDTAIFSRKMLVVKGAIINSLPLLNCAGTRNGLWALEEVERDFSTAWRTNPSGTPTVAMQLDHYLYLLAAPTAGIVSTGNNYVVGTYLAANMIDGTDDSNQPDLPEELHEAIVRIAAVYASDPLVTESEGLARLGRYNAAATSDMMEIRKRNERLFAGWGSTGQRATYDYIVS